MDRLARLHWPLIAGLGALALLHPVANATGVTAALGRPLGPLMVTGLISLAWLLAVALAGVRQPLLTLVATGATYGVFALLIAAAVSSLRGGQVAGPLTSPAAVAGVLISNAIWGALVGLAARALRRPPR